MRDFFRSDFGKGFALAVLSAFCFGFQPVLAVLVFKHGGDVNGLNLMRFAINFAAMGLAAWYAGQCAMPRAKDWKAVLPLSISAFLTLWLYTAALVEIPVSLAVVIIFTYPMLIAVQTYFFQRHEFSPVLVASVALGLLGVGLVVGPVAEGVSLKGCLLAVGAALACAFNLFRYGQLVTDKNTYSISALAWLPTLPAMLALGLIDGMAWPQDTEGWLYMAAFQLGCLIGLFAIVNAIRLMGALRYSIVMKLEPLVALLAAAWILGEAMAGVQMVGAALLIGALLMIDKKPDAPR